MSGIAYRVVLEPDEDGFRVMVPAFPRIFTWGQNVADALEMAKDAILLEVAVARERGEELPDPDGDSELRIERVVVEAAA